MSFYLIAGTIRAQSLGQTNPVAPQIGQPAYAWVTVNVPPNAGLMAFDFTVTGDPVNDQNVFTLPAKFAADGQPMSTDMSDVSAYAGQSVELFFGLTGGTSTNCTVAIDGVRFLTIPQPKVGVAVSGSNVAVKWPAAATGRVLETTDSLAPAHWQSVPTNIPVMLDRGVATVQLPKVGTQKFYRLRRSP